jgi:hypothetical protein
MKSIFENYFTNGFWISSSNIMEMHKETLSVDKAEIVNHNV